MNRKLRNIQGERALLLSVLNRAILDAFNFKRPNLKYISPFIIWSLKNKNYVSRDNQYLSWDARRFLTPANYTFCMICEALGLDYDYVSEKIKYALSKFDHSRLTVKEIFKVEGRSIDLPKILSLR